MVAIPDPYAKQSKAADPYAKQSKAADAKAHATKATPADAAAAPTVAPSDAVTDGAVSPAAPVPKATITESAHLAPKTMTASNQGLAEERDPSECSKADASSVVKAAVANASRYARLIFHWLFRRSSPHFVAQHKACFLIWTTRQIWLMCEREKAVIQ